MPSGCRHAEGIGRKQGRHEQPQACSDFRLLTKLVYLVGRDSECVLLNELQMLLPQVYLGIWGRYVMPDSGNLHLATASRAQSLLNPSSQQPSYTSSTRSCQHGQPCPAHLHCRDEGPYYCSASAW